MKRSLLSITLILLAVLSYAQNREKLFSIEKKDFYVDDLLEMSEMLHIKSNAKKISLADISIKDFNSFLIFQLKVYDAKKLGIDKSKEFIRDFENSKKVFVKNHISNNIVTDEEINKYYERSLHILKVKALSLSPANSANRIKIYALKNKLDSTKNFTELILKYANNNLKQKQGVLNEFTTFRHSKEFDEVAFNLEINEISNPFKAGNSFYIIQLLEKKPNPGKIRVSHILIKNNESEYSRKKIDSIYQLIKNGADFGKIASISTEDKASIYYGGQLPWFGIGEHVPEFEKVAFSLKKDGEISKIFKTRLGWHIIQRIQLNKEYYSKNEIRNILANQIINDYDFFSKKYGLSEEVKDVFLLKKNTRENNKNLIFTIGTRQYTFSDYYNYLKLNRNSRPNKSTYLRFLKRELFNYYQDEIIQMNPELKKMIEETYDSLLSYLIHKEKFLTVILNKNDFFEKNKDRYMSIYGKNVKVEDISEIVRNDYSNHIDKEWTQEMLQKYKVTIHIERFRNINSFL